MLNPFGQVKGKTIIEVIERIRKVVEDQDQQIKLSLIGQGELELGHAMNEYNVKDKFYQMSEKQSSSFFKKSLIVNK